MNWEETIVYIRTLPEYDFLVEKAYFGADLRRNVEEFRKSKEYSETINILKRYQPAAKTILDIGCGNGISSVAFALDGYNVLAVEPDPSITVGAGAVKKLRDLYQLETLDVQQAYAENLSLPSSHFDVVYFRQAMHHAQDLGKFMQEAARVLKRGGLLISVRDHVIFDEEDKRKFLEGHPLQKFYGGENAFTPDEYKGAMIKAGLVIQKEIKFFESPINYFPIEEKEFRFWKRAYRKIVLPSNRYVLFLLGPLLDLYTKIVRAKNAWHDVEKAIPGRMYSYICIKP